MFFFFWDSTFGQSPLIPRGDQTYHTYDRLEILRKVDTSLVNSINNFNRKETIVYLKKAWNNPTLTNKDRYDLRHIFSDNYEFLDTKNVNPTDTLIQSVFRENYEEDIVNYDHDISKKGFDRSPFLEIFLQNAIQFFAIGDPFVQNVYQSCAKCKLSQRSQ
ncbi:MAG: hypothetical protein IPO92_14925 [Saprospiraceae bacterium]|nr:hypothetical protein [Saprospiraceae bacterium]